MHPGLAHSPPSILPAPLPASGHFTRDPWGIDEGDICWSGPGCELGFTPSAVLGAASSAQCPVPSTLCPQSGFVVKRRRPGGGLRCRGAT